MDCLSRFPVRRHTWPRPRGTAQRNRRRLWKYRKFAGRGNYDEPPLFAADGQAALEQWLAENITYPTTGFENGLHGEVTVRFTVEPDGSLDGIEATAYDDAALAAEAVAALHRSPAGCRGEREGEPVAVTVTLPVSFRNAIRPKEAVFAAGDSQPADFMGGGLIAFRSGSCPIWSTPPPHTTTI